MFLNKRYDYTDTLIYSKNFLYSLFYELTFFMSVIVFPLSTMTLWRNDCLKLFINIELDLNAITGYHSAMVISHDVVTAYVW